MITFYLNYNMSHNLLLPTIIFLNYYEPTYCYITII